MNNLIFRCLLCFVSLWFSLQMNAAAVPVHDPSVIVVYKDSNGNSFPINDSAETRIKYYYVFGTQLGAAYSLDMINWTSFTPSFNLNGNISTDYYNIFKTEADYANQLTSNDVFGNLWAPDIIYNPTMNKWCMYFSLSGYDFKSSVILLTSTEIEGPYTKVGTVVYGGFTNQVNSPARSDYANVTGSSVIDEKYLNSDGTWNNDYGVSCIDPSVLYDEEGKLWMNYGSWSGGIYLLQLDENTGLRDYSVNYSNTYDGSRLRSDQYFGKHIAGGYYVSGEGPYIEYIKDANDVGYYYLFMSLGFYSPEGGYTMRVYRSSSIDGVYTDVSGDEAVFANWVFNYGNNVQYGFPIMQNYKWSWWEDGAGEIAQGHNSVLQDDDGKVYLIYHRKFDNGTAWHNVEVHQLFFNSNGWIVASPFEHREGFGLNKDLEYNADDISGYYGIIVHAPVDYENLATNIEQEFYLNADGSVTGTFEGNWEYNYADGRQFITLSTNQGDFEGVVSEELMNDVSSKTIAFTAMNPQNELALWGYKKPNTKTYNTVKYNNSSLTIGDEAYSLSWDAYDLFHAETVSGDFEIEYAFQNNGLIIENWHNWSLAFVNEEETWHLRADAWSNSTFTGSTVGYDYQWDWDSEFKELFANKIVRVKVRKVGSTINVFAFVEEELVYKVSCVDAPDGSYTIYLGGEAVYLDINKITVGQLGERQLVGSVNDDGTYTAFFNSDLGTTTSVSGDFELRYNFNNYHNALSDDSWSNFILRAISTGNTMLLRSDAFAFDVVGSNIYNYTWEWDNFIELMSGANVDLVIKRDADLINYKFDILTLDGEAYSYQVINTGAPTGDMSFGFTCEESMVDILEVEIIETVGGEVITGNSSSNVLKDLDVYTDGKTLFINSKDEGYLEVMDVNGKRIKTIFYSKGINQYFDFGIGVYIVNRSQIIIAG